VNFTIDMAETQEDDWGDDNDNTAETPWGDEEMEEDDWGDDAAGDGWGQEEEVDEAWGVEANDVNVDLEEQEEKGPTYTVHALSDVVDMMEQGVSELSEHLQGEDRDNVRLLLQYYKWKPEKANELYWSEAEKARIAAGVDIDPKAEPPYEDEEECRVCLEDVEHNQWLSLKCGHKFCHTCWLDSLEQSAKTRDCIQLTCPEETCSYAVTIPRMEEMGLAQLDSGRCEKFAKRVKKFTIDHFISCNNTYRYCPGVGCDRIIEMIDSSVLSITCTNRNCQKSFCWKCSQDSHHPAPCKVAEAWSQKNAGQTDDDMKWIISNSKKCPGCGFYIERNQGCNHMTCRHPNCGHEFCWMCGADWNTHGSATGGFYKCNIYEAKKADKSVYDRERKAQLFQEELKKYRFYYERYMNHIASMNKMKDEEMIKVEQKIARLTEKLHWKANEAAFIREAAKTVEKNRHLLAWTYAIGFYIDSDLPIMNLFQKWQGDLENFTDRLHEKLEKSETDYLEMEFRTDLKTYSRTIAGYHKKLVMGIETDVIPMAFPKGWEPLEIDLDC